MNADSLREQLDRCDAAYEATGSSELSDLDYDLLKIQYESMTNIEHMYGSTTKGFAKRTHIFPMRSLKNAYSVDELKRFAQRVGVAHDSISVTPKFHGMPVELVYYDGVLDYAVTRGKDGEGDDVTRNLAHIDKLPRRIPQPGKVAVYGEILCPFDKFAELNLLRKDRKDLQYAHPLNAVIGLMKRHVCNNYNKPFIFMPFDVSIEYYDTNDMTDILDSMGFTYKSIIAAFSEEQIIKLKEVLEQLPYPTDGLVFKVARKAVFDSLGYTSTAPVGAIAYKFTELRAVTRLLSVTFQVGGSGKITPVAELQPVQLLGNVVKRASLHNVIQYEILKPSVNAYVTVIKAKEIIPQIVDIAHEPDSADIPFVTHCPKCAEKLQLMDSDMYCFNEECEGRILRQFIRFCSRRGFNVGLGGGHLTTLLDMGLSDFADLFTLKLEVVQQLDGFGHASAMTLIHNIEKAKTIRFTNFIYALGIPKVAYATAATLAEHFQTPYNLLEADYDELVQLPDIGNIIATNIINFIAVKQGMISRLLEAGVTTLAPVDGIYAGKAFCITGSFDVPREDIMEFLELQGAAIKTSVSKYVDFLLVGKQASTKKISKAQELNIKTLTIHDIKFSKTSTC